jgi:hypothetical protein
MSYRFCPTPVNENDNWSKDRRRMAMILNMPIEKLEDGIRKMATIFADYDRKQYYHYKPVQQPIGRRWY